jgi:hypothetical protein
MINIDSLIPLSYKWLRSTPSEKPHIFITGSARSGTTLVKILLMAHSLIAGIDGESTGAFKIRNFRKYRTDEIPNETMYSYFKQSKSFVEFYNSIANEITEVKSGRFFVDKIWPNWVRFKLVNHYFIKSKWILCVRDGRDCFCSARRHPNVPQNRNITTFARYWKRCFHLARSLPHDRAIWIKYEDLVFEPGVEVGHLMDYLKLQFEPQQIEVNYYSKQTSIKKREHHRNLAKPINKKSVARWRKELTSQENDLFCQIAGDTLKTLGYEV